MSKQLTIEEIFKLSKKRNEIDKLIKFYRLDKNYNILINITIEIYEVFKELFNTERILLKEIDDLILYDNNKSFISLVDYIYEKYDLYIHNLMYQGTYLENEIIDGYNYPNQFSNINEFTKSNYINVKIKYVKSKVTYLRN